jgi:hypothetical protein
MQSVDSARLIVSAALLWATASALSAPALAATGRSAGPTDPSAQATAVPFEMPGAAGETAEPHDTGAGESASTVNFAPGVTGTEQQIPAEFLDEQ